MFLKMPFVDVGAVYLLKNRKVCSTVNLSNGIKVFCIVCTQALRNFFYFCDEFNTKSVNLESLSSI